MTPADPFGLVHAIVDGRYRVERVVGQGGFGVVYRARHLGFDSPIALKVLRLPEGWSSERREARIGAFQQEGRVLFELSHLHASIVRAHETGRVRARDGSLAPYLALEWLDGVSLDAELKARRAGGLPPLSLPAALRLLYGVADGLARAHAAGVAHRDIKPGNLFVAERAGEQRIKILDFGVAKLIDEGVDTTERFALTAGNTASFTPLYAAPEQWLERLGATGAWTDVHALALVVVELLTGRPPFSGRDSAQLMAACLDPLRPTPRACGAKVSSAVEGVFARALALEPRARFVDAGAFWKALVDAADFELDSEPPTLLELASCRNGADADAKPSVHSTLRAGGATATTAHSVSLARVVAAPASRGPQVVALAVAAGAATMFVYGLATRGARLSARPIEPSPSAAVAATSSRGAATSLASTAKLPSARPLDRTPTERPDAEPAPSASSPRVKTALRGAEPAAPHRLTPPHAPLEPAAPPVTPTARPVAAPPRAPSLVSASGGLVNVDDPALLRRN